MKDPTDHPLFDPLHEWVAENCSLEPDELSPQVTQHVVDQLLRKHGGVGDLQPYDPTDMREARWVTLFHYPTSSGEVRVSRDIVAEAGTFVDSDD